MFLPFFLKSLPSPATQHRVPNATPFLVWAGRPIMKDGTSVRGLELWLCGLALLVVVHVVVVAVCALLSKPVHAHPQRLKNSENVNCSLSIMMYFFFNQVLSN